MSAPVPIRYEAEGADLYDDIGSLVGTCDMTADGQGLDMAEERAAEIARRWNAHAGLLAACEKARSYLEARGIRHLGTEGRTVVLPMLDAAIEAASPRPAPGGA